jgi:cytochrome c peroxidase
LPPDFTDFRFHTTGVSQAEYDGVHGAGAFMALAVPGLAERNADYDAYLPVTVAHPDATERFRHAAEAGDPEYADLGMWNVYLNPDMPKPQANLASVVCAAGQDCSVDQGLGHTLAEFKTPTLRDLEDSAPYFHNGSAGTFDDVVAFYVQSSALARAGQLRNTPPEFAAMSISPDDLTALVAFLKSLTEDYDDA